MMPFWDKERGSVQYTMYDHIYLLIVKNGVTVPLFLNPPVGKESCSATKIPWLA